MTGQLAKLPFGKVRAGWAQQNYVDLAWAGAKDNVVTRNRLIALNFRRIQGAGGLWTLLVQITVKLPGAGLQKTSHHSPWATRSQSPHFINAPPDRTTVAGACSQPLRPGTQRPSAERDDAMRWGWEPAGTHKAQPCHQHSAVLQEPFTPEFTQTEKATDSSNVWIFLSLFPLLQGTTIHIA